MQGPHLEEGKHCSWKLVPQAVTYTPLYFFW